MSPPLALVLGHNEEVQEGGRKRTYLLLVSSFFVRLLRSGNLSRSPATCGWSRLVFLITLPSPAGDWQKVITGEEVARVAKSQNLKRDYPTCLASPGVLRLDRWSASLALNLFGRLEICI